LPNIANALVNTGLNFRKLGHFMCELFTAHMKFVESSRKVRIFNEDKAKFRREYEKSWTQDPVTNEYHYVTPTLEGFPFTAENIIKAASYTYPTNERNERIDMAQRALGNQGYVHFGIDQLEIELHGGGSQEQGGNTPQQQMELNLESNDPEDDSLMPSADTAVIASHDYYYEQLMKTGFFNQKGQVNTDLAVKTPPPFIPETEDEEDARMARGEYRPSDMLQIGPFTMIPITKPRRIEM
jgi:hypothetical protein